MWARMTKEEREEATRTAREELQAKRTNRHYGTHNNDNASFSDTRATLAKWKQEASCLYVGTYVIDRTFEE